VYTEASAVLTAIVTNSLTESVLRSVGIIVFDPYQDAATIMHRALGWKRSMISMFEVEAVPHSCIP
jgi:hypothetical protein